MNARWSAFASSCLLAVAGGALAQEPPPLGEWTGEGTYCVGGAAVTVPEGVEIISFGAGVEFRLVGGVELGELLGPATNGVPTLEAFADQLGFRLNCGDRGPEVLGPMPLDGAAVDTRTVTIVCRRDGSSFGAAIAAAPVPLDGEERSATLALPFGDTDFTLGGLTLEAGDVLDEGRLMPLFTAIARSLGPCSVGE